MDMKFVDSAGASCTLRQLTYNSNLSVKTRRMQAGTIECINSIDRNVRAPGSCTCYW
jgi:hypothetical protein